MIQFASYFSSYKWPYCSHIVDSAWRKALLPGRGFLLINGTLGSPFFPASYPPLPPLMLATQANWGYESEQKSHKVPRMQAGSWRCHDRNRNRSRKQNSGYAHCITLFPFFVVTENFNDKIPNLMFYGGCRKWFFFLFMNLDTVCKNSTPRAFTYIWVSWWSWK